MPGHRPASLHAAPPPGARLRGDDALRRELHAFSRGHPRWGYRRAWATLREEGWSVNRKRVQRLWRETPQDAKRSSSEVCVVGTVIPGGGLIVAGAGPEAAVQVADEAVGEGALRLVVEVAGGAPPVVEVTAARARSQRAHRPLVGGGVEPQVADEARLHGPLAAGCYRPAARYRRSSCGTSPSRNVRGRPRTRRAPGRRGPAPRPGRER